MKWLLLLLVVLSYAHDGHDHHHDHDHHDHAPGDGHEHVLVLDSNNFDTTVNGAELTLVEFYAPWCGHCQRLAPEYEAAASQLYGEIPLAKVDCTVEKDLCTKYAVQGFPTLKLFRKDGTITEYNSGRTTGEIVKFLKSQAAPAFTVIDAAEALAQFKEADSINVVGFFSGVGSSEAEVFKGVANALRGEATFAIATPELAKAEGASTPSVHVYKKFDDHHVTHTGDLNAESITKFVKAESLPVFGEIGPENYQAYVQQGFPLLWSFLDFADETNAAVETVIVAVAKQFKQKVTFVKLDGKKWAAHAKNFGLSEPFPGLVIEDREKRKNYVFSGPVTEVALAEHVRGYVEGKLAPTVKSQEPPLDNNEPVKVIVGKTFDAIVNDASKDVLVEFYAPWCGHCKTLAPKYEELGKEFKDEPTIVIAKVDATENDTPADIKGFPTLIFYPANNKANPLTYKGERSTKALSDFIRENAVTLKKPKKDEL